jgi:hypothetical protein
MSSFGLLTLPEFHAHKPGRHANLTVGKGTPPNAAIM